VPPAADRIEAAIEKLTNVSVELKALLAVHEQRISQQEKETSNLDSKFEKRRDLMDERLKDVYNTMREQDNSIIEEISKLRKESSEQHNILHSKINQLERYIYTAIGGGMVITWLLTNAVNYLKLFY
jgi:chromosome condensin MukBEF ATPase and DNA-binding subunit MukB